MARRRPKTRNPAAAALVSRPLDVKLNRRDGPEFLRHWLDRHEAERERMDEELRKRIEANDG
jgi:hypothetical protein